LGNFFATAAAGGDDFLVKVVVRLSLILTFDMEEGGLDIEEELGGTSCGGSFLEANCLSLRLFFFPSWTTLLRRPSSRRDDESLLLLRFKSGLLFFLVWSSKE
jgi:hypothetical protein